MRWVRKTSGHPPNENAEKIGRAVQSGERGNNFLADAGRLERDDF